VTRKAKRKGKKGSGNTGHIIPWKPGQSGNPSGRPKSFGHIIRHATAEGEELVTFALSVLRGEQTEMRVTGKGDVVECVASLGDRLKALEWLSDRGWGKSIAEDRPDEAPALGAGVSLWQIALELAERLKLAEANAIGLMPQLTEQSHAANPSVQEATNAAADEASATAKPEHD
jgi:Family of unknown function (DUF5681)